MNPLDGGRIAIAAILATGVVMVLVIVPLEELSFGDRSLPIFALLLAVVLLLLLPDLINYVKKRRDKE